MAAKKIYEQVIDELGTEYNVPEEKLTPSPVTDPKNEGASVTVSAKGISKTMKYGIIGLLALVVIVGGIVFLKNRK